MPERSGATGAARICGKGAAKGAVAAGGSGTTGAGAKNGALRADDGAGAGTRRGRMKINSRARRGAGALSGRDTINSPIKLAGISRARAAPAQRSARRVVALSQNPDRVSDTAEGIDHPVFAVVKPANAMAGSEFHVVDMQVIRLHRILAALRLGPGEGA